MPGAIKYLPDDEHNKILLNNVHPPDWINPQPQSKYNLVVIGAGTAGLVSAIGAAGLGARVALVERHMMGGDCLNVGCVPSKMMIRAARAAAAVRDAGEFGIEVPAGSQANFGKVMERMRRLRAGISRHDSARRFSDLGIDVFIGQGTFVDSNTVDVDGTRLKFSKAVIATGARAVELPIPGLKEAGYLTNENVFSLTEKPGRLAVIGGGPIGSELAQTFQRLGTQVVLIEQADHILAREDADAAEIVQQSLLKDGVVLKLNAKVRTIEKTESGKKIFIEIDAKEEGIEVDEILLGVGRAPNTEGLNLEGVGVTYDNFGVQVSDTLQTTNSKIFACGDICMKWKFTHAADFAARAVIRNTLFPFLPKARLSSLTMPWATYTSPEIAHVGIYQHEAKARGIEIDTYRRDFKDVDRAIAEGDTEGFVKIHTKKGSGEILGATIVNEHAGDLISEISVAMKGKVGLGILANVIHPYPTSAEAIRQCGDAFNRTRLTPLAKKIFNFLISRQR